MGRFRRAALGCFAPLLLLVTAPTARAELGEVLTFETSPRALALGGAAALPSDDPFAALQNPAFLAHQEGLSFGRARLAANLNENSRITADRSPFQLGVPGLGFSLAGRPFSGLGSDRCESGFEVTLPSYQVHRKTLEIAREFGIGLESYHLLRGLSRFAGRALPPVDDVLDVSLGWRRRRLDSSQTEGVDSLAPRTNYDLGNIPTSDFGTLVRLTPYRNILGEYRRERFSDGGRFARVGGIRVDMFAGIVRITRDPDHQFGRLASVHREAFAIRAATGLPAFLQEGDDGESPGLARFLGPAGSVAVHYQRDRDPNSVIRQRSLGAELRVLDVLALRASHVSFGEGGRSDNRWGFGLHLRYGDAIALRYDWASLSSTYDGTERWHPWSISTTLNPLGFLKLALGG